MPFDFTALSTAAYTVTVGLALTGGWAYEQAKETEGRLSTVESATKSHAIEHRDDIREIRAGIHRIEGILLQGAERE